MGSGETGADTPWVTTERERAVATCDQRQDRLLATSALVLLILHDPQCVRTVVGSPTRYIVLVTVSEAARALGVEQEDYIYRLCRTGALVARKDNGVWNIDPVSVEQRRRRIAHKRSSAVNAEADRQRRRAEAAARYATA